MQTKNSISLKVFIFSVFFLLVLPLSACVSTGKSAETQGNIIENSSEQHSMTYSSPSKATLDLVKACDEFNSSDIKNALLRGADPNYRDEDGYTPLMHIAYSPIPKEVTKPEEKRQNIVKRTFNSVFSALTGGFLADDGYEPNIGKQKREQRKYYRKMLAIVALLVKSGADPNARQGTLAEAKEYAEQDTYSTDKETDSYKRIDKYVSSNVLHLAHLYNNIYAFKALLKHGANPRLLNLLPEPLTSTDKSLKYCQLPPLELALSRIPTTRKDYLIVEALLDHDKSLVNFADYKGITPLIYVLYLPTIKDAAMIEMFVKEYDADIEKTDNEGLTPLYHAINQSREGFDKLIELGANVNVINKEGITPLMDAIGLGDNKSAKTLIEKGADLNTQNNRGASALHYSIAHDNVEMCKILLVAGVKRNIRDQNGLLPIHYICYAKTTKVAKLLLKYGFNINKKDVDGYTPMHFATHQNNLLILEFILKNKGNINALSSGKDGIAMTPLMVAVYNEHLEATKFLLDNGADRTLKNPHGDTVLGPDVKKNAKMMALLKRYGVK